LTESFPAHSRGKRIKFLRELFINKKDWLLLRGEPYTVKGERK
jgi:hypothetical protein